MFKFNVIFIHLELKGNCGEDVCFNNARSVAEMVKLKKNLGFLSPQFRAPHFLFRVL